MASRAFAQPCEVAGDRELAGAVRAVLDSRGSACVPARVERRGESIVVASGDGGVERVVADVQTAATIIESWGSRELIEPLLATREIARVDSAPIAPVAAPTAVRVTEVREIVRGTQLFASAETSLASDGTNWLGPVVGGCIMLGPVCAAARVRFAKVVSGPGLWQNELDRKGTELLIGGDVPLAFGRATLTPGFGGGIGMISTHVDGPDVHMRSATGGLRFDAHAALSYPLGRGLALELSCALDITQATHVETNTTMQFPDEPWLLARFGIGVRYDTR